MAIRSVLQIQVLYIGDGTTTSFTFDFTKGPFNVNVGGNNPVDVQNPVGQTVVSSVSLNGTKITVVFATAPSTGQASIGLNLIFPGA